MQRITTKDALDLFILNNQAKGLSRTSNKFYRNKINNFIQQQNLADVQLTEVNVSQIRQYLKYLQDKGLKPHSCQSHAKALRVFFNWALDEDVLESNPMKKIPLPKARNKKPVVLSEDEIKAVIKSCNCLRDKLLLMLSLDTGLRAMELCNLNWDSVVENKVFVQKGKGSKDRVAFIGNKTKLMLARYYLELEKPAKTEPLFLSKHSKRLTISGVIQFYKRLRKKTGNSKLTSHTIRRTALTNMLKAGMSVYHLKEIAGHEDIKTLQHYINIDDDLERAFNEYGLVDRL